MLATAGFATNRAASEGRNDIQYQQRQAEQYRDKFPLRGQTVFLDRDFANSAKADHREGGEMAGYTAIAARLNEGSASRPASTVKKDQPLAATALLRPGVVLAVGLSSVSPGQAVISRPARRLETGIRVTVERSKPSSSGRSGTAPTIAS
jgi:hypothetical protein